MQSTLVMTYKPNELPEGLDFMVWFPGEIETALKQAKYWYIDTETYPKNWIEDDARNEYSKIVTRVTENNFLGYYNNQRKFRALDPKRNTIRLVQIHIKDYVFILDKFEDRELINIIFGMIPDKNLCGTNIKFDLMTIYQYTGKRLIPNEVYDVMVGNRVMMFQRQAQKHLIKNSYKEIVKKYFDVDLSKENQSANWGDPLTSDMIYYAYMDVIYLPKILLMQAKWINKNSANSIITPYFKIVTDFITKLEMEFIKVVVDLELEGVPVNVKGLKKYKKDFQIDLQKSYDAIGDMNSNSPQQVVAYLKSQGVDTKILDKDGKVKDTANKSMLLKNIEVPLVPEILTNKRYRKLEGTIDKYTKNPVVHSNWSSIQAYTGRMSSSGTKGTNQEPLQTIDRDIKGIFYKPSDDDWVMLKADYPNIEARIAGVLTRDKKILSIFKNNEDMHTQTARFVLGMKDVTKEERQKAKAVNFGFIYGAGAKTFQGYAFDKMGLIFSLEQAQEYRRKYLELYEGINQFHYDNSDKCREYHKFITKTLLGRRMMVQRFTDANNFPVQGTGADFIKMAALDIWSKLDYTKARIISIVHDEIFIKTKPNYMKECSQTLKDGMETVVNNVLKDFHTEVEVDIIK